MNAATTATGPFFDNRDEAIERYIRPALEPHAADFDLGAICDEAFEYRVEYNAEGAGIGSTAGWYLAIDEDDVAAFWSIVEKHAL